MPTVHNANQIMESVDELLRLEHQLRGTSAERRVRPAIVVAITSPTQTSIGDVYSLSHAGPQARGNDDVLNCQGC